MSEQETLFGVMWQRVMASPLRVRMHYGHPDIFDKVWALSRGGTAKASVGVNVSEDIFAGFNVLLRGGTSSHAEFLCVGKGRDVGALQIAVFEAKISGGTAISATSRDTFRVCEGMDFARLLSFWHTSTGFYVSNVLVVVSLVCTVYYFAIMALTGADYAILASRFVYLVGDINVAQWVVQLGLLSLAPLLALHTLEAGLLPALAHTLGMFGQLAPVFFMNEIMTKAWAFDNALCFGRQSYAATGRDFVIRHLTFVETFKGLAHSHLYLGVEMLLLLALTTSFGVFESVRVYIFFFLTGWLFSVSLCFGQAWFNPLCFEWESVRSDCGGWWRWVHAEASVSDAAGHAHGGAAESEGSWRAWYESREGAERQYDGASAGARVVRLLRISRLLLPAACLALSTKTTSGAEGVSFAIFVASPFAAIALLQISHLASIALEGPSSGAPALRPQSPLQVGVVLASTQASEASVSSSARLRSAIGKLCAVPGWCCVWALGECMQPSARPIARIIKLCIGALCLGGVLLIGPILGIYAPLSSVRASVSAALAFVLLFVWASRAILIIGGPLAAMLRDGVRAAQKAVDICVGLFILSVQVAFAAFCPLGHLLHTRMIFSSSGFSDAVDTILGTGRTLRSATGLKSGGALLDLGAIGQLQFGHASHKGPNSEDGCETSGAAKRDSNSSEPQGDPQAPFAVPQNRIGLRRFRLRQLPQVDEADCDAVTVGGVSGASGPTEAASSGAGIAGAASDRESKNADGGAAARSASSILTAAAAASSARGAMWQPRTAQKDNVEAVVDTAPPLRLTASSRTGPAGGSRADATASASHESADDAVSVAESRTSLGSRRSVKKLASRFERQP